MNGPWHSAEELAHPEYKWLGERFFIESREGVSIPIFTGGVGFSFFNCGEKKSLKVTFQVLWEDQTRETYLLDAAYCGELGAGWQKWQTDCLPVFPHHRLHGAATHATFSYTVAVEQTVLPSRYVYRFAERPDLDRGYLSPDDFNDHLVKRENHEPPASRLSRGVQEAYEGLNATGHGGTIAPFFTRGDPGSAVHPVCEIHRAIDRVIERKTGDPGGRHSIRFAVYDIDNEDLSRHLVHAAKSGVEIECLADWSQVGPLNASANIAGLRRAGIQILGLVRNNPRYADRDMASMHTKFMLFDDDAVHSCSYNLHFHLWGGNWENGLIYRSKDANVLFQSIYDDMRYGRKTALEVDPAKPSNIYYSFGDYRCRGRAFRVQDALLTEISRARDSITVCMFDLSDIGGTILGEDHETGIIDALIRARDRGVRVKILLNGMNAHSGPVPAPWDKNFRRPLKNALVRLKDAWIELFSIYYHDSIFSPLHHKFAVVDGSSVVTGSYNWYEPSLRSDEILTIHRDPGTALKFEEEARLLLERFRVERE